MIKPFLKWAGGKGQLLSEIESRYPFSKYDVKRYVEPFVGGGAVLFSILSSAPDLEEIYINDINRDLTDAYIAVRDSIDQLILMLSQMEQDFLPKDEEARKVYFYEKRDRFNELKFAKKLSADDRAEKSATLIFLNRTCFNGLYRVNRKGAYNVPMGRYKMPTICNEANLRAVSERMQRVNVLCAPYEELRPVIDDKTFVYIDPPYRPLTRTADFTSYTNVEFGDEQQKQLAQFSVDMANKGALLLVSNSDPKNVDPEDNFFEDIYTGFTIDRVYATRMINSKATARGKITELLMYNYDI